MLNAAGSAEGGEGGVEPCRPTGLTNNSQTGSRFRL